MLDEIEKNDYPIDAKVDGDKDDMKLLLKKVHVKEVPIVLKEKQRKLGMSNQIPVKKAAFNTEKTEKYTEKLNPNAPPFFILANATKKEDIFGLLKGMIEQQAGTDIEMEYFDGNPLEYYNFIYLFRDAVEKLVQGPKGRLLKSIQGKKLMT